MRRLCASHLPSRPSQLLSQSARLFQRAQSCSDAVMCDNRAQGVQQHLDLVEKGWQRADRLRPRLNPRPTSRSTDGRPHTRSLRVALHGHPVGTQTARAGVAHARSHLRRGETLVAWKLDRLGRTTQGLIDLVEPWKDRGMGVQRVQDQSDSTPPMGQVFFVVCRAIAALERRMIRARSTAGLAAARARGRQGGRPFARTGAERVEAMTLIEGGRASQWSLPSCVHGSPACQPGCLLASCVKAGVSHASQSRMRHRHEGHGQRSVPRRSCCKGRG